MTINFPEIRPSSRQFIAPDWPTTERRSQSGVTSVRLWGSKPSGGQLNLGFNNIRDELGQQILETHENAKGSTLEITLPSLIFDGYSGPMKLWLQEKLKSNGLRWFFRKGEAPQVESVVPGICSARVSLIAELRIQ